MGLSSSSLTRTQLARLNHALGRHLRESVDGLLGWAQRCILSLCFGYCLSHSHVSIDSIYRWISGLGPHCVCSVWCVFQQMSSFPWFFIGLCCAKQQLHCRHCHCCCLSRGTYLLHHFGPRRQMVPECLLVPGAAAAISAISAAAWWCLVPRQCFCSSRFVQIECTFSFFPPEGLGVRFYLHTLRNHGLFAV